MLLYVIQLHPVTCLQKHSCCFSNPHEVLRLVLEAADKLKIVLYKLIHQRDCLPWQTVQVIKHSMRALTPPLSMLACESVIPAASHSLSWVADCLYEDNRSQAGTCTHGASCSGSKQGDKA